MLFWQHPEQLVESQPAHAPFKHEPEQHCAPTPHGVPSRRQPASPVESHCPWMQVVPGLQVWQKPPPRPQAPNAMPGWQTPSPSRQPGQAPPVQKPASQVEPLVQAWHAKPPTPHASFESPVRQPPAPTHPMQAKVWQPKEVPVQDCVAGLQV
jgi:hypothetical protein